MTRPAKGAAIDALYLSPHLDDAAFSCGGQIHARTRRGERVAIATVFAGPAPSALELSSLAVHLHRLWGLDCGDAVAARRDEDRRAAEMLGATSIHLDLPDAIYRLDASGAPLYPAFAALFCEPHDEDAAIESRLRAALDALPESRFVAAPLGIGDHVDHRLVHRVAREVVPSDRLWFYEDFPYAESWRARRKASTRHAGWATRVEAIAEEDLVVKSRAIACYASQLGRVWRNASARERRLRRFHRRRGGERLWSANAGGRQVS